MEAGTHPVARALADLARAFPQRDITAGTLGVYLNNLGDLPADAVVEACAVLIRTSEFFPTVHLIRETVAERSLGLPTEAEALAQLNDLTLGTHPLVAETLRAFGGRHTFRVTDNPSVLRGQFAKHYRELRAARVRDYVVGDLALPAAPPVRELTA